MPPISADPALRAGLERQYALLVPVVDNLRAAAIAPSPLSADDWRGPAAEAATAFLAELRAHLRDAADAVDDEARRIRLQLAAMP